GIFHLMREDPDAVQLRLHRDRQVFLLLGSAITVGEDIIGYVVISIADEELRSVFPMLASGLVFADSRGYILHAEESVFYDERNRIIPEFAGQTGRVYIHARDYYVSHAHVFGGDLVIYAIYCRTYFRTMLFYTFVPFVAIFFLLSIFLFKSAKKLANKSTARIDKLHDAFVEIQKGQLDSYVSIEGIEEFETIGATFNQTLASLNAQIRRNNEMTETMVAAQIKQLESQFHPHFLFNVLENIRAMCKIDPAVSACMIVELSALLRYSISGVESQVSVSEDLAYTKNYLSLMGKRFNSRFSYKLDVDDDVLHCYIPKLLVQPLIENAIKHGFDRQGKLEVQVEYKRHAGDLIIICKDNGAGIDEETLEQLKRSLQGPQNESEQLGLYNVHRRIQLKYNSNYGLTIESVQHVGTSVTIRLPILNETIE
ncbi:MAG: sensor histidine kinase, partial [Oscillospiraceae bacterium]|nr:sensor histidine kinase [Oscillospiraceae bacterium]